MKGGPQKEQIRLPKPRPISFHDFFGERLPTCYISGKRRLFLSVFSALLLPGDFGMDTTCTGG